MKTKAAVLALVLLFCSTPIWAADFPTALTNAVDGKTDILAKHINNLERKVGIDYSADPNSLTYQLNQSQGFKKLRVANNATTPTTKIDISADSVTVYDSSSNPRILVGFSKTVDCTTVGANGKDTNAALATGWYYFYVIAKSDGTMAGLASSSATVPAMPSGYIYKKLVSAIHYGGSSFLKIIQFDRIAYYNGTSSVFTIAANSYTSKDLSSYIPSIALSMMIQPFSTDNTYDLAYAMSWNNSGTAGSTILLIKNTGSAFDTVFYIFGAPFWYLLNPAAPQTIYVKGADTNNRGGAYCTAYELDI